MSFFFTLESSLHTSMHLINLAHFWDDFPKKLVHQDVFRLDEIHLGIDVCDVALFILQSLKSEVCVCVYWCFHKGLNGQFT